MEVSGLFFKHNLKAPYFFENIAFSLEEGKLHALHGKNGIGKSVLLHLLSGAVPRSSCFQASLRGNKPVLVSQRFEEASADEFSFYENLQLALMGHKPSFLRGLPKPTFLPPFLEQFNLDLQIPVYRLSGGQRQILSLMMHLQRSPQVILLDEPTAALDRENAEIVCAFLRTLSKDSGVTILVVCHDQALIERYTTGQNLYIELLENQSRTVRSYNSFS